MDFLVPGTSEQAARFGRAERVIAGRHAHQQGVLVGVLEAEVLQVGGCLRDLAGKERKSDVQIT